MQKYSATKIDDTKDTSIPWKQANRLLSDAVVLIASPETDTPSLSQNLHSFFIDKVEKLSPNIAKLFASHQRQETMRLTVF